MKRRASVHGMAVMGTAATLGSRRSLSDPPASGRRVLHLDSGWKFLRDDPPGAENTEFDDARWQSVTLPHAARIESLVTGAAGSPEAQWQGICW